MDNFAADFIIDLTEPLQAEFDLTQEEHINCTFEVYASGTVWGSISGNINNQTDLIELIENNYNDLEGQITTLDTKVDNNYNELSNDLIEANQDILDLTNTVNSNFTTLNNKIDEINIDLSADISELNTAIQNEATTRAENDTLLQNNIDAEALARQNADTTLQGNIDTLSGTVTSNYNALDARITTNTGNISDINTTLSGYGNIVTHNVSEFATSAQGALADTALQPNDNISELVNDVGYITSASLPTDYVPETRTINGYALSQNITLNYSDVGALSASTTINDLTTIAQQNALNSGATTTNIGQITINSNNIANLQTNKQDVISDLTTIRSNALAGKNASDTIATYGNIVTHNVSEFATSSQGALADTALQPNDNISELTNDVGYITSASLPIVNNGTLDIQVNGTSIGTFTANQSGNTTANIVVPDSATWGNITGTLSNQIDLQNALNSKYDASNPDGYITSADLPTNYVTTDTVQNISGRKTFLGEKAIYFKQTATTDKLGFTLYNPSNTELGALEWRPNTINGNALLALNCSQSGSNYVGFRYWSGINIVAPRPTTNGNYFIPVNITDGINTVTANNNGTLNISSLLPDVSDMATQTWVTNQGYTTNVGTVTSINNIQPDASGNVTLAIPDTATWGNITGTLSDQTDLQDVLNKKQDKLTAGENITIEEQQEGWTSAVQDSNLGGNGWVGVAYGNNKFVAIGEGGYVSTSTDGTTWTSAVKDSNLGENDWFGVAYGNNKFVAIGYGAYVSASADGTTWTSAVKDSNLGENDWSVVAYDGTKFVAIGISGYVSTSADGTTWTPAVQDSNLGGNQWVGVAYGNNKFVAIGVRGYVSTSTDGTTWTLAVQDSNLGGNQWVGVAYDGTKFVAIGRFGYVSASTDGTTWTPAVQDSNLGENDWSVVAYGNNKFVAIGEGGYVSQYFAGGTIISATVPTVNNGTLTIQKNGTTIGTFTANQSGNSTINIEADTVLTDDITVSKNSDDELQTVAVIDQNNTSNGIKTWTGTRQQYDAIATKDANTLYNITDDTDTTLTLLELLFPVGAVYFGTMSVCPLQTLGVGTWQALPPDKVIQIAGTRGSVGDTLNESLPNVAGTFQAYSYQDGRGYGAFSSSISAASAISGGSQTNYNFDNFSFNASNSSSTYQDNAPVQQDAYLLNGWRRIA